MSNPMTLTPAIKEKLEALYRVYDAYRGSDNAVALNSIRGAELALLSVVAAEEGRKYAPILEALKWYADENNYCDFAPGYFIPVCDADGGGTEFAEDEGAKARSALAQWEAP